MEGTLIYIICSAIILLGSAITAIFNIYNIVKNPAKKYKEKQQKELKELIVETIKEVLPELLTSHDLEVKERYKSDRDRYLCEIKSAVISDIGADAKSMQKLLKEFETLRISTKDILREKIIKIYLDNKDEKALSTLDREKLEQFYIDYKDLKGNSYIDKYYKRMAKWKTLDDDDEEKSLI